jgi:DNA-binding beta-propeller fold protein YncE
MHRFSAILPAFALACFGGAMAIGSPQQPSSSQPSGAGPYKVVKTVKVGGLGGFDYIFADVDGRRLYIPRGAVPGTTPVPARVTVFDLDTLAPAGDIPDTRANGAAVDTQSGHGFASSKPVAMWDTKTLKVIKTIDVQGNPDGILADPFNHRVYVFSHAPHTTVIDARDGAVLGTIDLGGAPEQAATDERGHIYVDVADKANVAVIDAKTMTVTAHYDLGDKGSALAGLALDVKNQVLFVACRNSGTPQPGAAAQPVMVILNATNGKIITTLPLAGGSDGAVFNPATMEAFSTHGNGTLTIVKENSPTSFDVEQNLQTMTGAKTLTLDTKTNHVLTMAAEYGPVPAPATPPAAGAPAGRGPARGPMIPDSFSILVVGK